MSKLIFSAAALMLATTFSFAGTPETKGEVKSTELYAPPPTTYTYHVTSENLDGTVNFASGPASQKCNGSQKLCEWQSSVPMTSPQDPLDIESNSNTLPETITRRN